MPKTNTNTKDEILALAETLFLTRGFNGFSYKQISAALNIKNAAIHYHYPSKTDLGVAIVQKARTELKTIGQSPEIQNLPPKERLEAFLAIYESFICEEKICLGGALATDFNTLPEEMQSEAKALLVDILQWLEALLAEGISKGDFSFQGTAKENAIFILASIQGVLQICRVMEPNFLKITFEQIRKHLTR